VIRPNNSQTLSRRVGLPRATLHAHRPRVAEQPPPVANDRPAVVDLVVADMRERKALGVQRYGVALQPGNGRDGLRDLYEELLDACCYIRQVIEERDRGITAPHRT
jgi:hypothetical protein